MGRITVQQTFEVEEKDAAAFAEALNRAHDAWPEIATRLRALIYNTKVEIIYKEEITEPQTKDEP